MSIHRMLRWYNALLYLFPPRFRDEFGQEMVETFAQRLAEARLRRRGLLQVWLDELVVLPLVLLEAYTAPKMSRGSAEGIHPGPLAQPWRELILALAVFLLPAGMLLSARSTLSMPGSPGMVEALFFLGIMLALGWIGGFPLWSRPYVGLILTVSVYLYIFQHIASHISPALITNFAPGPWDRSTYQMLQIASNGMLWLMLFCLTLLAVALLAVFNRIQPLLQCLRYDWSMLSYILYGESVFALLLLQSRQPEEPGYLIASLLCLAAGIWLFLSASRPAGASHGLRLLALLACLTLAIGILAIQTGGLQRVSGENLLLVWGWMAVAVLLPGLLVRVFTPGQAPPAAGG